MEQTVQDAPDQQVSLTDPDARSMATSGKGTATVGYNVQIAVEAEHHLIVAPRFPVFTRSQPPGTSRAPEHGTGRMAHKLFNGRIAFVGETPWHALGVRVPPSVTAAEMIDAARLSWKVNLCSAPGARLVKGKPDRYMVMRDPVDGEREKVALGIVRGRYTPLQNTEAFSFFEPFISNGWAQFHTAGALGRGNPSIGRFFIPAPTWCRHQLGMTRTALPQCTEKAGWGGRIRTSVWRNQNPLPYHLATPHRCRRLADR